MYVSVVEFVRIHSSLSSTLSDLYFYVWQASTFVLFTLACQHGCVCGEILQQCAYEGKEQDGLLKRELKSLHWLGVKTDIVHNVL